MHFSRRSPSSGTAFVVLIFLVAACGTPAEQPTLRSDAPEVQDQAGAPAAPEGGAARLPEDFPEDFPLPSEFTVTEGQFTTGDATTQANFLVRGTSPTGVVEIANFYRERLPEAGYELIHAPAPDPGAMSAAIYFESEKFRDASVQLTRNGGPTSVLISLPLRD